MSTIAKIEQAGRSMVEMLGVLAIIGVLSVGGISGYSKAMAKYKLTKAQDQMSMLLINIRTAYATSSGYAGLTTQTAYEYNILPKEMAQTSTQFVNAFGGEIVVGTDTDSRFTIELRGLGKETCISLATSDWGTEGLHSIEVGTASDGSAAPTFNESHTLQYSDDIERSLPIVLSRANIECASKDATNAIRWTYY